MSDVSSVFKQEPGTPAAAAASAAVHSHVEAEPVAGSRPAALAAAAAVSVAGGLVWAGVVIVTRFDLGILAWFLGAAAGLAAVRLAGRSLSHPDRVVVALFAAAGILLGKYVIYAHDLRAQLARAFPGVPFSDGYLDSRVMHVFVDDFSHIVKPIYYLWIALAFIGALRATSGRRVLPGRRA